MSHRQPSHSAAAAQRDRGAKLPSQIHCWLQGAGRRPARTQAYAGAGVDIRDGAAGAHVTPAVRPRLPDRCYRRAAVACSACAGTRL